MKKFLALVLSLIMIAGLVGCGGKKEAEKAPAAAPSAPTTSAPAAKDEGVEYDEITISAASGFTEYVSAHQAWLLFEQIVEERSGGAMQVELYPNQQLGGDREFTEACAQGNVTMGSPSSSPAAAFCAALNVYDSPFIYADRETAYKALDSEAGKAILDAMEMEPLRMSDYEMQTVTEDFLGTNYSSACAWWTEPDTITTYVRADGKTVTSNFTGREVPGSLYVSDQLNTKNQYAYFLGGNQPLCVIRSRTEGPKVLVLRDSYADCLAPFLSERFQEVHLFDLRYNRLSPADYIRENGIDMVLILYSFETFMGERIVIRPGA